MRVDGQGLACQSALSSVLDNADCFWSSRAVRSLGDLALREGGACRLTCEAAELPKWAGGVM